MTNPRAKWDDAFPTPTNVYCNLCGQHIGQYTSLRSQLRPDSQGDPHYIYLAVCLPCAVKNGKKAFTKIVNATHHPFISRGSPLPKGPKRERGTT